MRDYEKETTGRVAFIREALASAGAAGIVFGNSGGKDCALAGILCKMACENTVGLILPCGAKQNYGADRRDARLLAKQFNIETREIDLSPVKEALTQAAAGQTALTQAASANMAPRLRMAALYAAAASENRLVAGTGNRSEIYMGYFTKWGDGAFDFNPVSDLTVTEVYEFLRFLGAPPPIIEKAPSAGLFEGQTDEAEMGIPYQSIDTFLLKGAASERDKAIIGRYHSASGHKRRPPLMYGA